MKNHIHNKKDNYTFSLIYVSSFDWMNVKLCKLFGHKWRYRDYSNHIKSDGGKYDFLAARSCMRCGQFAYYQKSWRNSNRLSQDYESNYY